MSTSTININNILFKAINENKSIMIPIIPILVGYYLQDTVFTQRIGDATSNIDSFLENANIKNILNVFSPYMSALVLFLISNAITSYSLPKIEMNILHDLTGKIIESIKTTKKNVDVNEIMMHIRKVSESRNIYKIIITYIFPTIVVTVGLIHSFWLHDRKAGIAVMIIIAMLIFVTISLEFNSLNDAYKTEESSNGLFDEIHEIMTNMDTVITSNTKDKELENITHIEDKTYEYGYVAEFNNGTTTYGLQFISMISVIGVNYISYSLYMEKKINTSIVISIALLSLLMIDYYNYCTHAIADLIGNIGKYYEGCEYFSKFEIIHKNENIAEKNLVIKNGNINLKNISLKYGKKVIFKNVNIDIKGGKKIGLIGPIGSGKSTLLKMMAGIINYEGKIYVDNQDIKYCTYESIVKYVAYISQHPKLFNKSILYNLNYGSIYTEAEIWKILEKLGLGAFYKSFPNKLHTIVGKEGCNLSGGQKQVVAITRSIVQNKSIILLDEPTSSLDVETKKIFINLIKKLTNKTILISTHDEQIMDIFDTTINMEDIKNNE
jgi:ABC-type multidrug transport system fused ATPase/permease subunit